MRKSILFTASKIKTQFIKFYKNNNRNNKTENINFALNNKDSYFTNDSINKQLQKLESKIDLNKVYSGHLKQGKNMRFSLDIRLDMPSAFPKPEEKANNNDKQKTKNTNHNNIKRKRNLSSTNLANLNLPTTEASDFLAKEETIQEFRLLALGLIEDLKASDTEFCELLDFDKGQMIQMGHTRVFMKEELKSFLENKRRNIKIIVNIQAHVRKFFVAKKIKFELSVNKIIKAFRIYKKIKNLKNRKNKIYSVNNSHLLINNDESGGDENYNNGNLTRRESPYNDSFAQSNPLNKKRMRYKSYCSNTLVDKKYFARRRKSSLKDLFDDAEGINNNNSNNNKNCDKNMIKKFYINSFPL